MKGDVRNHFEQGFDFILSHFEEPIWPRNIVVDGVIKEAADKTDAMDIFEHYGFRDCKISAHSISADEPSVLCLNIPRRLYMDFVLKSMATKLSAYPTVIESRGFHIYQPIKSTFGTLKKLYFSTENPFDVFLPFAESYLSNGYASDSITSSKFYMMSVPNSLDVENKVIHRWDQRRVSYFPLLESFMTSLVERCADNQSKTVLLLKPSSRCDICGIIGKDFWYTLQDKTGIRMRSCVKCVRTALQNQEY